MKRQWKTMLGLAALAFCLSLPAMGAEEEGEKGGRWKRFRDRRQQNQEGGERGGERGGDRGGDRGGRMQDMRQKQMENLPGAKEEFKRHQEAMKAIREEGKALHEKVRESMKNAEGEEERKALMEQNKGAMREIASKTFDEMINHQQKMLDLRKANKEAILDNMAKRMKKGPGDREGGEGMQRGKRGGDRGGHEGRGPKRGGGDDAEEPRDQGATEDEISRALEEALK